MLTNSWLLNDKVEATWVFWKFVLDNVMRRRFAPVKFVGALSNQQFARSIQKQHFFRFVFRAMLELYSLGGLVSP